MRKVRADGTVWYYYYKKKIGRKKKRGPKKKKLPPPPKIRIVPSWDYRIIFFSNKQQQKIIGKYKSAEDAYNKIEKLLEENKNIVFAKEFTNNGRNSPEVYKTKNELLILKKNTDQNYIPQLRNDFGKLVDHTINLKNWIILDKFPYNQEETFWAYGYDNKKDRKTFNWIYENFILNYIINDNFVNIYVYNNKVIFRYDNKDFNFVICKNVSDAIKMYNLINEKSKNNRQIILTGANNGHNYRGRETIEMIRQKTGWNEKKITEKSTRH